METKKHTRKLRRSSKPAQFYVLVLEQEQSVVFEQEQFQMLFKRNPRQFFLGISSVMSDFKQADLLKAANIPVIAFINQYEDELRDELIKRHVLDYVVKTTDTDTTYVCDLVVRLFENIAIKVLIIDDSKVSQFVIARELAF